MTGRRSGDFIKPRHVSETHQPTLADRRLAITDMGPHELWDEPWEGLPEEDAAWEWNLIDEEENGATKNPPNRTRG